MEKIKLEKSKTAKRLLISCFIAIIILFLVSPYDIGPVKEFRFLYYMKELGILKDHRPPEVLINLLQSEDIRVQVDAMMTMARKEKPDKKIIEMLRQYIDGKAPYSLKNIAIYALGELRVKETLPQLQTRIGDMRYDQQEIKDAIDKINGVKGKPWWKELPF